VLSFGYVWFFCVPGLEPRRPRCPFLKGIAVCNSSLECGYLLCIATSILLISLRMAVTMPRHSVENMVSPRTDKFLACTRVRVQRSCWNKQMFWNERCTCSFVQNSDDTGVVRSSLASLVKSLLQPICPGLLGSWCNMQMCILQNNSVEKYARLHAQPHMPRRRKKMPQFFSHLFILNSAGDGPTAQEPQAAQSKFNRAKLSSIYPRMTSETFLRLSAAAQLA
jgi:hypothetical protein